MEARQADTLVQGVVAALKKQRLGIEMSQYRVAELTGLSREAIRLIESGERSPTLHSLFLIARAIEIDLSLAVTHAEGKNESN